MPNQLFNLSSVLPGHKQYGPRRGLMIVISSPSGAGKTSLCGALLEQDPGLQFSVSATTRPKREHEVHGVHYYFHSEEEFSLMVENDELLEHAQVFDRFYGTPRAPVLQALKAGRDLLFDIDWQGAQQLRQNAPTDLVTIAILPPSVAELEERLRKRGQDSEEAVRKRMKHSAEELSHWQEFSYVLINRNFDDSLYALRSIIAAERLMARRQTGLAKFGHDLLHEAGARR